MTIAQHIDKDRYQWRLGILQSNSDVLDNVAEEKAYICPFVVIANYLIFSSVAADRQD